MSVVARGDDETQISPVRHRKYNGIHTIYFKDSTSQLTPFNMSSLKDKHANAALINDEKTNTTVINNAAVIYII